MNMILIGILMVMTGMSLALFIIQTQKVDKLIDQQIALASNVAELKRKLEEQPEIDTVEQQIAEAKEKVFTEWIQNIANYTPFNSGGQ